MGFIVMVSTIESEPDNEQGISIGIKTRFWCFEFGWYQQRRQNAIELDKELQQ